MADVKITKKDRFAELKTIVEESGCDNKDELIDFLDAQIDGIETRAAKAKERNAAKKAEGDALRDAVQAALTDEFQSAEDILAQIDDPEATKGKVVSRLTALGKAGIVVKDQAKRESGGGKVTVYKLSN